MVGIWGVWGEIWSLTDEKTDSDWPGVSVRSISVKLGLVKAAAKSQQPGGGAHSVSAASVIKRQLMIQCEKRLSTDLSPNLPFLQQCHQPTSTSRRAAASPLYLNPAFHRLPVSQQTLMSNRRRMAWVRFAGGAFLGLPLN